MKTSLSVRVILLLQGLAMAFAGLAPFLDGTWSPNRFLPENNLDLLAHLVGWPGALLGLSAVIAMGQSFTVHPSPKGDGKLVVNFPFSLVRNPIYTALFMMYFGWGLFHRSFLSALSWVALLFVLRIKVSFEEDFLRNKFGQPYIDYCSRVGRFIPRLF